MIKLTEALNRFDRVLEQTTSKEVANRLQSGLTRTEIDKLNAGFPTLPNDVYDLYQWHNGLSGQPTNISFTDRLIRLKNKWHGELSGRENELHLQYGERLIIAKFLPLNYAWAGHRHLKLGRCLIDLLPIFIVNDGKDKYYGMIRLDARQPVVYYAKGTAVPPMRVSEEFLSVQIQFGNLTEFVLFLTDCCYQAIQPRVGDINGKLMDTVDYEIDSITI
ncbi:hypothetical protein C7B62_25100 [Pleurocapsa sp. CCALA 161]|uniref:hypothetical protein n=1 Tax=Pleurocapsa sp. CCALA 161 TaxID=2107688 RepID=UPI000D054A92|nr:hypothetical protein [Pleurocapsa sp. CCALA 161]PSB05495.1 hypothetical protein C7B62_25100 [Pleurocapsa sp. CCALA 161]